MADPDGRQGAPVPVVALTGERVVLGPLRRDLIPTYARWNNDFGVTRNMSIPRPWTTDQVAADLDHLGEGGREASFTIYERATGRPIGNVGWTDIDWRNRTSEYVILIGEPDCRGRGFGTAVTRLMLAYAFDTLGLHSVMLRVYAYNLGGLRAYTKAGFREFGRRRQAKMMGGKLWDVVLMECLASEYAAEVGRVAPEAGTSAPAAGTA